MGRFGLVLVVLVGIVSFLLFGVISKIWADEEFTQTLPDYYWGPKELENKKQDESIRPFKINVENKVLETLKSKLKEELSSGRFAPPLEGIAFEYGMNSEYLKTVGDYWLNKYDWRAREKLLNKYPQFKTKIAGLDIHFQHVKSQNNGKYKKTRPLILLHGWPGSFVEFQKIIPLLTDPKGSDLNFELVIPSIPGYTFSDPAVRPGLGPVEVGQVFVKLMKRLGYDKFYIQGGDWGSAIGSLMARTHPQNVVGYHSNFCLSNHPKSTIKSFIAPYLPSLFFTPEEAEIFLPASKALVFLIQETGYMHIQATKPDTVGAGLSHSPTGLLAYIGEKFSGWTNGAYMSRPDGGLTEKFTMDEFLDDVMLYWVTNSITTSMRIYSEYFSNHHRGYGFDKVPTLVPSACLVPKYERYIFQPKSILLDAFPNMISHNYAPDGGHFFALEHPDVLAADVIPFIKTVDSQTKTFDKK